MCIRDSLFSVTMKKLGIDFTFVRPDVSEEELNAAFRPSTKAVFAETLSNPSLDVLDIEKFAKAAHAHGVPLIVDNTFPTPINCQMCIRDSHGTAGELAASCGQACRY